MNLDSRSQLASLERIPNAQGRLVMPSGTLTVCSESRGLLSGGVALRPRRRRKFGIRS